LPHILVLADPTSDLSFASDHATTAGAVAAGLFLVRRVLGWIATVATVAVAFARVCIAAHYPHDVAGRLDDPRQHQLPEHVITVSGLVEPKIVVPISNDRADTVQVPS
jgi:hypothetical protein